MILMFKQKFRVFALTEKFDVFDEAGNVAYKIQGRFSIPKRFDVYNAEGEKVAMLKSKVFDILPQFRLFIDNQEVGKVKKKFTFFKPKFKLNCNDWRVDGDFFAWNYQIFDATNNLVATMQKRMGWTDQYALDIVNPDDALMVLMIVLAIDAEKAERHSH